MSVKYIAVYWLKILILKLGMFLTSLPRLRFQWVLFQDCLLEGMGMEHLFFLIIWCMNQQRWYNVTSSVKIILKYNKHIINSSHYSEHTNIFSLFYIKKWTLIFSFFNIKIINIIKIWDICFRWTCLLNKEKMWTIKIIRVMKQSFTKWNSFFQTFLSPTHLLWTIT